MIRLVPVGGVKYQRPLVKRASAAKQTSMHTNEFCAVVLLLLTCIERLSLGEPIYLLPIRVSFVIRLEAICDDDNIVKAVPVEATLESEAARRRLQSSTSEAGQAHQASSPFTCSVTTHVPFIAFLPLVNLARPHACIHNTRHQPPFRTGIHIDLDVKSGQQSPRWLTVLSCVKHGPYTVPAVVSVVLTKKKSRISLTTFCSTHLRCVAPCADNIPLMSKL